uniref:hypothetical protein n=1 Tax=Xanthomonas sp. 0924 TaxID=2835534 RepID=UPI003F7DBF21
MSEGNRGCLKMALVFAALIAGFFVVIFIIGGIQANSDPQSKVRWRDKEAIELCWESYERKSLEPSTKRFVAMSCEKMERDFKAKYGRDP